MASLLLRVVHALPAALWIPTVALVVWTYLRVYSAREAPRRVYALVACAATLPALMLGREQGDGVNAPPAPMTASMSARALWDPASEDRLEIAIATSDPDSGRMRVLEDGVVIVDMRDGSRQRLRLHAQELERTNSFEPAVLPVAGRPAMLGMQVRRTDTTRYTPFWVDTGIDGDGFVRNVLRFTVEGRLVDYDLREVDRIPVRTSLARRRDGRQLTVDFHRARGDTAGPRIDLGARWLVTEMRRGSPWPLPDGLRAWNLGFALISPDGTLEVPLRHSGYPGYAGRYGMPGLRSADQRWSLHPATWSVARPPVTDGWLDSALVIVGTPVFHSAVRVRAVAEITPP